ncbi:MAG: hypothetical protein IBJ10_07855 [Phycisphaerales bacterium]|nr:hypothetical protein [Phycisphaerales bacterium]
MKRALTSIVCAAGLGAAVRAGDDGGPALHTDPAGDALVRRTDVGADGPMNPLTNLPDLLELRIGPWDPDAPATDLFVGDWEDDDDGDFVRIDVVFAGVVNPPGNILGAQPFNPFRFGPSPLHGFIELDVDNNRDTGGECGSTALYRYLANVGRFGRAPYGSIAGRMARWGEDLNTLFGSAPQIERSGADFVVSFCGCFNVMVMNTFGDGSPATFDAGDTWLVRGRFFQRAGGFEEASGVFGGSFPGLYDPQINARFAHDTGSDRTTVSLVFPLTPAGAGMQVGQAPAPMDLNVANQFCVQEAIEDLIESATKPGLSPCAYELIERWRHEESDDHLEPADWGVRAIFGTTYATLQPPYYYIWTDTGFDDRIGDFDGSGDVGALDADAIDQQIALRDGGAGDADGVVNGAVQVPQFAGGFSVYDVNGDGVVNKADRAALGVSLPGDLNGDCVVDFADLNLVASYFNTSDPAGDANGDGVVDFADLNVVISNFSTNCR